MKMNLREKMLSQMKSNKNSNKLHKALTWYFTCFYRYILGRNIRIYVRTTIGI